MRHAAFIGLIGIYALTVLRVHGTFLDYDGRLPMMYVVSCWCACYWQGPYTPGVFDPYPFRSAAILVGSIGIVGTFVWTVVLR